MMYSRKVYRTFVIFMVMLNTYGEQEHLKRQLVCRSYENMELNDTQCNRASHEILESVFRDNSRSKFGKFEIVRSKLIDVDEALFHNASVNMLQFYFCSVQHFHFFKGLRSLKNLRTLIIEEVIVKKWIFTPADEEGKLLMMQEFTLLDCPEKNENDAQIIRYLPANLTKIRIIGCRMKSLDLSFERFSNLVKLDLNNNLLTTIKRSDFPKSARHLWFLSLSKNPITSIPEDIFTEMPSLRRILLYSTSLKDLPYNAFKPILSQIVKLDIGNNLFNCDCQNSWLLAQDYSWERVILKCVSPASLKNRNFHSLTPKEMCQPEGEDYETAAFEYCISAMNSTQTEGTSLPWSTTPLIGWN